MIGKLLYREEVHIFRFENGKLQIFKDTSDLSDLFQVYKLLPDERFLNGISEDSYIYFFDILSGITTQQLSEFFCLEVDNISYFKSREPFIKSIDSFGFFKSLIFCDGIVKTMIYNDSIEPIYFENDSVYFARKIEKEKDHFLFNIGKYGKMLTSNPNEINVYKIIVDFTEEVYVEKLNTIIERIYKFISFLTATANPYIKELRLTVDGVEFLYFYNKINYNESSFKTNYLLDNFNNNDLYNLYCFIVKSCDLSFLNCFYKETLILNDSWLIAKSIESLIKVDDKYDKVKVNEADQKFYQEMNNAIKAVIKTFDDADYFSENSSQKDFFLSMTKYPTFKKKLIRLIDYYNEFANKYNDLNEVGEPDKSYIVKRFSVLRNSIHDNEIQISAEDENIMRNMCYFIYVAIFVKNGIKDSSIFNFIKKL